MLRVRLDLNRLLPANLPERDQLRQDLPVLQSSQLFQYVLLRLQRRVLDLQQARSSKEGNSADEALFSAGTAYGARLMLDVIESALAEASRGAAIEQEGENA